MHLPEFVNARSRKGISFVQMHSFLAANERSSSWGVGHSCGFCNNDWSKLGKTQYVGVYRERCYLNPET